MNVIRTERGWPGHFIAAEGCIYRRNTLLELGERRVVVSTVGNYREKVDKYHTKMAEIGCERYYETMAFEAVKEGCYWETDVGKQLDFDSPWGILKDEIGEDGLDNKADGIHEAVVAEITETMLKDATCQCGGERFTTKLVGDESITTCDDCGREASDEKGDS